MKIIELHENNSNSNLNSNLSIVNLEKTEEEYQKQLNKDQINEFIVNFFSRKQYKVDVA